MNRMLAYEKFKLKKSKYWWICSIVLTIITSLTILGIYFGNKELNSLETDELVSHIVIFTLFKPAIIGQNSLLISILIGTLICSDFSNGTIKNIASKGITRTQIVLSKLIVGTFLGIILISVKILTGLILGYFLIGFSNVGNEFWIDLSKTFLLSILQTMAYVSIFTFSGFIFKKSSSSITLNIVLTIFVPVIILITSALLTWYNYKLGFDLNILIPNSILLIKLNNYKDLTIYSSMMIFYIILGTSLSILIFNKKDVK